MGALICRAARAGFVLVLVLVGAFAHAEPPSDADRAARAKAFFDLGRTHFSLGDFESAAKEFEQAYQYDPAPLLLYNVGQSWRRAQQAEKAIVYYRKYLEAAPNAAERAEVERHIAELQESIENHPTAPVEPTAAPSPATATPSIAAPTEPAASPSQITLVAKPSAPPPKRHKRTAWIVTACIGAAVLVGGAIAAAILIPRANDPASSTLGSVTPSWMPR
jgi:tetratricopeptide (TPR) repeat protein